MESGRLAYFINVTCRKIVIQTEKGQKLPKFTESLSCARYHKYDRHCATKWYKGKLIHSILNS